MGRWRVDVSGAAAVEGPEGPVDLRAGPTRHSTRSATAPRTSAPIRPNTAGLITLGEAAAPIGPVAPIREVEALLEPLAGRSRRSTPTR